MGRSYIRSGIATTLGIIVCCFEYEANIVFRVQKRRELRVPCRYVCHSHPMITSIESDQTVSRMPRLPILPRSPCILGASSYPSHLLTTRLIHAAFALNNGTTLPELQARIEEAAQRAAELTTPSPTVRRETRPRRVLTTGHGSSVRRPASLERRTSASTQHDTSVTVSEPLSETIPYREQQNTDDYRRLVPSTSPLETLALRDIARHKAEALWSAYHQSGEGSAGEDSKAGAPRQLHDINLRYHADRGWRARKFENDTAKISKPKASTGNEIGSGDDAGPIIHKHLKQSHSSPADRYRTPAPDEQEDGGKATTAPVQDFDAASPDGSQKHGKYTRAALSGARSRELARRDHNLLTAKDKTHDERAVRKFIRGTGPPLKHRKWQLHKYHVTRGYHTTRTSPTKTPRNTRVPLPDHSRAQEPPSSSPSPANSSPSATDAASSPPSSQPPITNEDTPADDSKSTLKRRAVVKSIAIAAIVAVSAIYGAGMKIRSEAKAAREAAEATNGAVATSGTNGAVEAAKGATETEDKKNQEELARRKSEEDKARRQRLELLQSRRANLERQRVETLKKLDAVEGRRREKAEKSGIGGG